METREGDHVDSQLPQVSIELAGEPQGGGHTGHGERHQMVQVSIGRVGQLQGPDNYSKSAGNDFSL